MLGIKELANSMGATPNQVVDLTVLVVNFNTSHLLDEMFDALHKAISSNLTAQIIVVDNASADDSVTVLQTRYPEVTLIVNEVNVGFGRANNQGLPHILGRYVLLLNTDAFVSPDTLTSTLSYMDEHRLCGVLGVRLVGRDGCLQPSCRYFPTPWNLFLAKTGLYKYFPATRMVDDMGWDHALVRNCDWVPGCYYLIRREVIDQVGLFDPRYFLYSEEVDHCRRVKNAGWEVTYFPETSVVHIGGESAKSEGEITSSGRQIKALQIESELLYFRKQYGLAGLCLHLVLSMLGDLILSLKMLIKNKSFRYVMMPIRQMILTWKLCVLTRLGSSPTR